MKTTIAVSIVPQGNRAGTPELRRGLVLPGHQLDIAIDWGRYGELFEYDAEDGELVLDSDPAKVGA